MTASIAPTASTTLDSVEGTYFYSLARVSPSSLAAISSDDTLRLFDPATLSIQFSTSGLHKDGVTCFVAVDERNIATAGRDGAVKIWDTRTAPGKPTHTFSNPGSTIPILSIDSNSAAGVLAAGTEHPEHTHTGGDVLIWDLRASQFVPKVRYTESHNDDVTELRFCPTSQHFLLSGSTDGLVNVYNLRTPPSRDSRADDDVEEALHQIINNGSSVHHAGFLPAGRRQKPDIWALSHDECLAIHEFDEVISEEGVDAARAEKRFGDVRETLGCEYVVDIVACVLGRGCYVAAASHSSWTVQLVHLINEAKSSAAWEFGTEKIMLAGAHAGEIVRSVLIDEATNTVFTAGEDGKIMVWKQPAVEINTSPKKERKEKDKKRRFKPY